MPQGAVLVLGMHRSGTSALARGLQTLGLELGNNLKPGIAGENDKGFFEDWTLSNINDELLGLSGEQWNSLRATPPKHVAAADTNALKIKALDYIQREFGAAPWFAFKDPRTCRQVEFWEDVIRRDGRTPFFVIAFRNPMSVARSLARRNGFSLNQSYYIWLVHYARAMAAVQDKRRACVEYDELVSQPGRVLERIADLIGDPAVKVSATLVAEYEREFLDPKLRNHLFRSDALELDDACSPIVSELYGLLRREAGGEVVSATEWRAPIKAFADIAPHLDLVDEFSRRAASAAADKAQAEAARSAMRSEVDNRATEIAALEKHLEQQAVAHAAAIAQAVNEAEARSHQRLQEVVSKHNATLMEEREMARAALEQAMVRQREQHADYLRECLEAERLEAAERMNATIEAELRKWEAAEEARVEALRETHEGALQSLMEEGRNALIQALTREREQHAFSLAESIAAEREEADERLNAAVAVERAATLQARADAHAVEAALRKAADERERSLLGALGEAQDAYSRLLEEYEDLKRTLREQAQSGEERLEAERQIAATLAQRLHEREERLRHLDSERFNLARQIEALQTSTSWRLTSPLRALSRMISGAPLVEPELVLTPPIDLAPMSATGRTSPPVGGRRGRVHFTICAKNYLPIARTCLQSAQLHHPEAEHVLVLCDEVEQGYDPLTEAFRVVTLADLEIVGVEDMILRYEVMELSTAIKPFAFEYFFQRSADEVVYLDPDLYFLSPLHAISDAFDDGAEAVVTPHINAPVEDRKHPNERDMLRCGVFNLGFLALRRTKDVAAYVRWWGERLRTGSVSDPERGLFTDQKWCDLLPCFIARTTVLHRPGYNLAYWNLMHRVVSVQNGLWTANGEPICFVHFSGASFTDAKVFSKHQDRFDADGIGQLRDLYDAYRDRVRAHGFGAEPTYRYAFDFDSEGRHIAPILRRLYREDMAPEGPRSSVSVHDVVEYGNEVATDCPRFSDVKVTRLLHKVWRSRPDLQQAFDLNTESGQHDFVGWAMSALRREYLLEGDVYPLATSDREGDDSALPGANPIAELSRSVLNHAGTLRPLYRHLPRRWRERAKVALTRSAYTKSRTAEAESSPARAGAALIGYARGELGMGEHVRMTAAALECQHVPMGIVNVSENVVARQEDRRFDHLLTARADFRANIFHVNADQLPVVMARLGDQFMVGKRNIAYPYWELSAFPEEWTPQLNTMDELWAPTQFIYEALKKVATKPVVHMPVAVELAEGFEKWRREDFGLPNDAFLFLFHFDLASFSSRKNPIGVIDAFQAALATLPRAIHSSVRLVVKVISAERFPREFGHLQEMVRSIDGVVLIPEVFSADKIHGLVNCADAFLSLHRSEGFGRGPAEAMRLGKVAIATGYSGNMDYMNPDNSFPVPYRLRAVGADEYPFGAGQVWADPNIAAAAAIMAKLVQDKGLAKEIGLRARRYMEAHHSPASIGARYAERLTIVGALG